jgi:hypothetical protein
MDGPANARSNWLLQGAVAELHCGALSGQVDVAHPHLGLRQLSVDRVRIQGAFLRAIRSADTLAVEPAKNAQEADGWPLPVADAYVRGNDLVASYRSIDDWPYAPQLVWQANTLNSLEGVRASLSLLVSVQTHLLDSRPQISVVSQMPSAEQFRIAIGEGEQARVEPVESDERMLPFGTTCCVIRRSVAASVSYVEIVSAADFCDARITRDVQGDSIVEWRLFAEFLEKGVIRRARIHSALVPRENDVELAIECCAAIEQSPLPLTA